MNAGAQSYLFKQMGLDSGSLTMLGAIVHQFAEPGEYRGVSLQNNQRDAVFYLTVEERSAVNQVSVDLATLGRKPSEPSSCCCKSGGAGEQKFLLGAKGHAVFHVSGGPGGYSVHVGPAAEEPKPREFDSVELKGGDLFAATFLRPGVYSVRNLASKEKVAAALELHVAYPRPGKTAYQPPQSIRIECVREGFRPSGRVELQAMQGCIFVCNVPARIKSELLRPYEPEG